MTQQRQQQQMGWSLLAVAAIVFALLILLVPHGSAGHAAGMVAILPLLLVGIISPLCLLAPLAHPYASRVPQAPALASRFQRPPPSRRN
jgi:hypothetical protein